MRGHTELFEESKASSARPSHKSIFKKKTGVDHWWNESNSLKLKHLEKTCSNATLSTTNT
jgi:hypothetical protein